MEEENKLYPELVTEALKAQNVPEDEIPELIDLLTFSFIALL